MQKDLLRFDKTSNFTFFDFETFNLCLNFCHNLPWELAMAKVVDGKIVDSFVKTIKWKTDLKISEEAAKITGYSQEKIDKEGLSSEEAFELFYDWSHNCDYLCGHNILNFDVYLAYEWFKLMKVDVKKLCHNFIDTNALFKAYKLQLPYKKNTEDLNAFQIKALNKKQKNLKSRLEVVGRELEIEHDYTTLHQAYSDINLNIKVWNKLKYMIDV